MKRGTRRRTPTIDLLAAISATSIMGHPARLVDVITLYASGLAAGVSMTRAIVGLRAKRETGTASA